MHLGKLKNESFIKEYKQYGFSTVTHLVDFACTELKRKLSKERRAKWREEALTELANVFSMVEDEYREKGQELPADSTEIVNA